MLQGEDRSNVSSARGRNDAGKHGQELWKRFRVERRSLVEKISRAEGHAVRAALRIAAASRSSKKSSMQAEGSEP